MILLTRKTIFLIGRIVLLICETMLKVSKTILLT